jgi:glycyl-radical enzyme activating protein
MKGTAIISDMQHFSTGDGPGIRTTIFLKGCNLHCEWCHNPETMSGLLSLMFYENLCTKCGNCEKVCPNGVHQFVGEKHALNRKLCSLCGECIMHCKSGALKQCGKELSVDEIMEYILEDKDFYKISGGGVTISGGEPLLQADFCTAIAIMCKANDINVIIDTAGDVEYSAFEKVIPFVDSIYLDLKGASNKDYLSKTGGNFERIYENLISLMVQKCNVVIRIPIIPGYNDTKAYCSYLASLVVKAGVHEVNLLPFHRLGSSKYNAMGIQFLCSQLMPPSKELMNELVDVFSSAGINVSIGG